MKNYITIIKRCNLFNGISEDELVSMLNCLTATKRSYKKGEFVYRAGDKVSAVALLLEGEIHIQSEDFWGHQSILTDISAGQLFGETYACIGDIPIEVDAIANRDSIVLMLDIKRVLTTCSTSCRFHTHLIQNFIRVLALKNKSLTVKITHISQRTIQEKVLSFLSEQSLKAGSASFDIPFNRQQLADYLAVDRSALSNVLCKLRDDNMLSFNKNHFILSKD